MPSGFYREKGLQKAIEFLNDKESGTCLLDRSIVYLGQVGSVSKKNSKLILSTLIASIHKAPDRTIRIIEGIDNMLDNTDDNSKDEISAFLKRFINDKRSNVMKKTKIVLNKLQKSSI